MMLYLFILWLALTVTPEASAAEANATYREGTSLYVWAKQGLNLREEPSPTSKVLAKLAYGTQVTLLCQEKSLVAYQLNFFGSQATTVESQQPRIPVLLEGHWIKARVAEQEGYVFDKLLLNIEPMHKDEEIEAYLIRTFHLNKHQQQKKRLKNEETGQAYTVTYNTYSVKAGGILFKAEEVGGDESTQMSGGTLSLPEFSFEKGFVFGMALLPPDSQIDYTYQAGHSFEYALDQVPNEVSIKKTKQGIEIQWSFSPP